MAIVVQEKEYKTFGKQFWQEMEVAIKKMTEVEFQDLMNPPSMRDDNPLKENLASQDCGNIKSKEVPENQDGVSQDVNSSKLKEIEKELDLSKSITISLQKEVKEIKEALARIKMKELEKELDLSRNMTTSLQKEVKELKEALARAESENKALRQQPADGDGSVASTSKVEDHAVDLCKELYKDIDDLKELVLEAKKEKLMLEQRIDKEFHELGEFIFNFYDVKQLVEEMKRNNEDVSAWDEAIMNVKFRARVNPMRMNINEFYLKIEHLDKKIYDSEKSSREIKYNVSRIIIPVLKSHRVSPYSRSLSEKKKRNEKVKIRRATSSCTCIAPHLHTSD